MATRSLNFSNPRRIARALIVPSRIRVELGRNFVMREIAEKRELDGLALFGWQFVQDRSHALRLIIPFQGIRCAGGGGTSTAASG